MLAIERLHSFDIYKDIKIKYCPGDKTDEMKLILNFKEKSSFFASA